MRGGETTRGTIVVSFRGSEDFYSKSRSFLAPVYHHLYISQIRTTREGVRLLRSTLNTLRNGDKIVVCILGTTVCVF